MKQVTQEGLKILRVLYRTQDLHSPCVPVHLYIHVVHNVPFQAPKAYPLFIQGYIYNNRPIPFIENVLSIQRQISEQTVKWEQQGIDKYPNTVILKI